MAQALLTAIQVLWLKLIQHMVFVQNLFLWFLFCVFRYCKGMWGLLVMELEAESIHMEAKHLAWRPVLKTWDL